MVKLDEATLTSQGQISIPKKIRVKLHLQQGDKVVFMEDDKGHVIIQEAETSVEFTPAQWDEFLAKTKKEPIARFNGVGEALNRLKRLKKK